MAIGLGGLILLLAAVVAIAISLVVNHQRTRPTTVVEDRRHRSEPL